MAVHIGYGRNQIPTTDFSTAVAAGGSTTVGKSLYYALQGYNRANGRNLLSIEAAPKTIVAGEKVTLTVTAGARLSGEAWLGYILSASSSPTDTTFVQLAKIRAIDPLDETTVLTFPLTLDLDQDEHFELSQTVANDAALPGTGVALHGMRRGLLSTGLIYEYDQYDLTTPIDGQLVFNGPGGVGRWKVTNTFGTYIANIGNIGGCAQDMREVVSDATLNVLDYEATGSASPPITLWLSNDTNTVVPEGTRVAVNVRIGELNRSNLFNGKLTLTFLGFVDTTTGLIRTVDGASDPMPSVGIEQNYNSAVPNLILEDDIQANEVYAFNIKAKFSDAQIGGFVPDGAFIRVLPSFITAAGVYSEAGPLIGNAIFNINDCRRVVPGTDLTLLALEGSGIINSYVFPNVAEQLVTSLDSNTAAQEILITGNGQVYYNLNSPVPSDSDQLALISTESGETAIGTLSSSLTIGGSDGVILTINYPSDANGTGTIRSDYPDAIANLAKGTFNPTEVNIYLQDTVTAEIRKFGPFTVIPDVSQDITISDWTAGTIVGSFPTAPSSDFSLYAPGTTSLALDTGNGANFTGNTYEGSFTFNYTGNQVTKISHSTTDGNVPCLPMTLVELISTLLCWQCPVNNYAELTAIPSADIVDLRGLHRKVLNDGGTIEDWVYDPIDTTLPDGTTVLAPDDVTHPDPGRWKIFTTSGGTTNELDVRRISLLYGAFV